MVKRRKKHFVLAFLVCSSLFGGHLLASSAYTINGKKIGLQQMKKKDPRSWYENEKNRYELVNKMAREHWLDLFFIDLAKKGSQSVESARAAWMAKNGSINDVDVVSMLNKHKNNPNLKDKSDAVRRKMVRDFLSENKRRKGLMALVDRAIQTGQLKIAYPKPSKPVFNIPVGKRDHVKGNTNAKLTIVEFSDFECPYCKLAASNVDAIMAKYKDKVKLVFKHFPLNFHPHAKSAARYAVCAENQGKFWEMHDSIFSDQKGINQSALDAKVGKLKLNTADFKDCLADNESSAKVDADRALGLKLGVAGTPSFFINGQQTEGGISLEMVEQALQKLN